MKRDTKQTKKNETNEKRKIFSFVSLFFVCFVSLFISLPEHPQFIEKAAESGLNFRHSTGSTGQFYMPEIMGPGAALLDYDNDGDLDIYLIQGAALAGTFRNPGNHLFRNEL